MTDQFNFGGEIIWRPKPEDIECAHLTGFMRQQGIRDARRVETNGHR